MNQNTNPKYWDIDDILAEEELVMVNNNVDQKFNGFLDKNRTDLQDLPKDAEIELPIWLALSLASTRIKNDNDQDDDDDDDEDEEENLVNINIPSYYQKEFQDSLRSGPDIINLRDKNPYFYELGQKIGDYIDDPELIKVLEMVYMQRMKQYIQMSTYSIILDCNRLITKMSYKEKVLFNLGRKKALEYEQWKGKGDDKIFGRYFERQDKIKSISSSSTFNI